MRVHRLDLTAFGPFAARQIIDFDALSDAGIFLLTGKTGAGKTSVLDAVCFGLYGAVPGARNNASDLKSHHAAPDTQPVVELEVTIRGRRFRINRSPRWSRPSRRARRGAVEVRARAAMSEYVDGEWIARSARLDEVGHLVSRVLGMNRDQFCQVVMLPQGQFQSFLRAGAADRHHVLEALFETSRFQRIEGWLNERRRDADHACAAHTQSCRELLSRIDEANGAPLLDEAIDPLSAVSGAAALALARSELSTTVERLAVVVAEARTDVEAAQVAYKSAEHTVDEARVTLLRQGAHAEAMRHLDELEATADVAAERALAVERAEAAARLMPIIELCDTADARVASLASALEDLASRRQTRADADDPAPVDALRAERARLARLLDTERELAQTDADTAELLAAAGRLAATVEAIETSLAEGPAEHAAASSELARLRSVAESTDRLTADLAAASAAQDAAQLAGSLAIELAQADAAATDARQTALAVKQVWLELRERYLDDVAGSLASTLDDGDPCPVCGSHDHPRPATAASDPVTQADERAAYEASLAADAALQALVDAAAGVRGRQTAALVASSGLDLATATARVDSLRADQLAADHAALEAAGLESTLTSLGAALDDLRDQHAAAIREQSAVATRLTANATSAAAHRSELAAALGDSDDVTTALAGVDDAIAIEMNFDRVTAQLVRECEAAAELAERIASELDGTGFASAAEVRSAAMTPPDIAAEKALARARDTAQAVALKTLSDPAHLEAIAVDAPDLAELTAVAASAAAAYTSGEAALRREGERHGRLEALADQFDALLATGEPLLAARDLAAAVATMCAGTAPDNATKTRLSHYVLAARLAQVVSAANLRLAGICGGRYELLHSMERGVADSRGGLGLRVIDNHTGQPRDPATLSGGETFYVSLALALGLADLVRDEVGGVELSTLFVDEGFGSLDSETLDEVLDEIDTLRSGGRCVGLVSHLSELRARIPTQLHVVEHGDGSTIAS